MKQIQKNIQTIELYVNLTSSCIESQYRKESKGWLHKNKKQTENNYLSDIICNGIKILEINLTHNVQRSL